MKAKQKTQIVKSLLRLGVFLQREGNRIVSDFGLNQQQLVVLKEIQEKGPVSQREICSELLLEKSNVSKIIGKLYSQGYITVSHSERDNRRSILTVTAKGNSILDRCMERLNQWNSEWLRPMSARELNNTVGILSRLESLHK